MAQIKAAEVAKLRKTTGAGMMDCKKALTEADGDFDSAIDILRKKGQKIANKRADRDTTEGAVIAKVADDSKFGVMIVLNCETDFVAKNDDFVAFATSIANVAIENKPSNVEALSALKLEGGVTIADEIINQTGVIGEKLELSYFEQIEASKVKAYIHPGNKVGSLAGFNKDISDELAKDIVMQIAAMAPVSLDKGDVPQSVIDKEIEVGKDQAINEGKPAAMAEKIALGRLNKFFKESTLLNQMSVKENKKTVKQVLQEEDKDLTVTAFKRFSLAI